MSAPREHHFYVAMGDLAFALAAFACGLFAAPLWLAALAALGMLTHWSLTRRAILNRLHGALFVSQVSLAVAVLIAILAGAYWLGLGFGGHF
jgi:hypothetical protein